MKKRLKEIEEEAGALREMQAKVEKEMGSVQGFCSNLTIFGLSCFQYALYFELFSLFSICSICSWIHHTSIQL